MKNRKIVARVSIGLDAPTLEALNQALGVRYYAPTVGRRERNGFIVLAIFAYSSAVARLGKEYEMGMLACDVRDETPDECAARNGEPLQQQLALPDNIVPLFPDAVSAA